MRYQLYYWPEIQGRGEFVRLALEDAGAAYIDVARGAESEGLGVPAMLALMRGQGTSHIPFAPPFLRDGEIIVSHTATILLYLGGRIRSSSRSPTSSRRCTTPTIRSTKTSGSTSKKTRRSHVLPFSAAIDCRSSSAGSNGFCRPILPGQVTWLGARPAMLTCPCSS